MNQVRKISVKSSVLEALQPALLEHHEINRYMLSHAVWQLARMGTYNEAVDLPLAIRIEATGDFTELFPDRDNLVCSVDTSDADLVNSNLFVDAFIRCCVFLARSRRPDLVKCTILISSKAAADLPEKFVDWEKLDELKTTCIERLDALKSSGHIKNDLDSSELVDNLLTRIVMKHTRRRQGRLGEDALWGREIDAIKVLEEAGINGSDLGNALLNLTDHASGEFTQRKKAGIVFKRKDAKLMIRDFQRRAKIQRPGICVIDTMFMEKETTGKHLFPRNPGWTNCISKNMIKRDSLDPAVRWARLAALKSGRGLLPVFFFTGQTGSGRSVLLKQVAWELYKDGFALAEILDLNIAAGQAEALATAAVSLEKPLILIWDDISGPGLDPVSSIREFAEAQLSGVPMMILASAPDVGYTPKKIRQISRTSFEEFEVHFLSPEDIEKLTDPVSDTVSESKETETKAQEENIQKQPTENLIVAVQETSDEPETRILEKVIEIRLKTTLDALAEQLNAEADNVLGDGQAVFKLIRCMGAVGLPVSAALAAGTCGTGSVEAFKKGLEQCNVFNQITIADDIWWDCGHPLIAQSLLVNSGMDQEEISKILNRLMEFMLSKPAFQPFAGRLIRSIYYSDVIRSGTVEILMARLIEILCAENTDVSPVFLSNLFQWSLNIGHADLQQAVVDAMATYARKSQIDSFIALTPLLRNRMGGIEDSETLEILEAARPDCDRMSFRFLLKFLSDHLPNDLRESAVANARMAAAREPDEGFAVAAYLRLCWSRGTEAQVLTSIEETKTWLSVTPDDRVVRRAFIDYVISNGSEELQREMVEPIEDWLKDHMDEGPLRNSLIELAYTLKDPAISDRVLAGTADWIELRGNNRSVRQNYFRRAERRGDKAIMRRACKVAVSWLSNHFDDRETVRSIIYLASRVGEGSCSVPALVAVNRWLNSHVVERDILRRYLILADRTGRGRAMTHAVETGLTWVKANPDDMEIREILLGLAARRVEKKVQIKVYDASVSWMNEIKEPSAMMEYLVGRLGVRAGIARRAIPLLERVAAKNSSELSNHARLWLGSAYRVAEVYDAAMKVWEDVRNSGDENMVDRANRNIRSLEELLKEKFPNGYPPPAEPRKPRPRPRPQSSQQNRQQEDSRSRPPQRREKRRDDRARSGKQRPRKPASVQAPTKKGATLGDLFRLKGLDLNNLTDAKKKK